MLFQTPIFLFIFLPFTVLSYYLIKKHTKIPHEIILIIAGYIFYAYWNIYLSPLIVFSILFNFLFGKIIINTVDIRKKKFILLMVILINILYLMLFKYTDFIIENINILFNYNIPIFNLTFPLAMSFFTFQTIAFLVDCYDGNIKQYNLTKYSLFIIFFPQLIAGPIVRYNHMVPQFDEAKNKTLNKNNIVIASTIILIGLFKKVLIADNLSIFVNSAFEYKDNIDFVTSWLTSLSFTFQIYFDFSGYVDMATGIALLFNIKLPRNFDSPFKATSIINFWQKWHITLSNFLMNYIYFPWAKSLKKLTFSKAMFITFIVFLIAGMWHGPSWTYVIFGCLHGIGIIINHIFRKLFKFKINKILSCLITFNYINFCFIFFRSPNLDSAFNIIYSMFGLNGFNNLKLYLYSNYFLLVLCLSFAITFFFKNINYFLDNIKLEK